MSRVHHVVSNHLHIHCLFNSNETIKAPHCCLFMIRLHGWPVDSPYKGPVMQKMFPCRDAIIVCIDFVSVLWNTYWRQNCSLSNPIASTEVNNSAVRKCFQFICWDLVHNQFRISSLIALILPLFSYHTLIWKKNGRKFSEDIFKCIFLSEILHENYIYNSLKLVAMGQWATIGSYNATARSKWQAIN